MRLYHPYLEGRQVTVPDSPRLFKVLERSGWKAAPDPEPAEPGKEPEPVRFEPVTSKKPKSTPKPKPTASDKPEEA